MARQIDQYEIDELTRLGFDHTKFTAEQIRHLLKPSFAPEDYYCDGEITPQQADKAWIMGLIRLGIRGNDFDKALKIIQ